MLSIIAAAGIFSMGLNQVPIAAERLAKEEMSDAEIVRALRDAGDIPNTVRTVSVYFAGEDGPINRLKGDAISLGWRLVDVSDADGTLYLWLEREQSTTPEDLARLRQDTLRMEAHYKVKYDGWETSVEAAND